MSFEQQLISWRRELHQNPELSLQEVATTARIRDWLQSGGLTLLPYDLKTGLVAEVGSGDKVIALRADIDALPIEEATGLPYRSQNQGVMHACGHDIHTSVMLGAALLLKEREAELPGRVRILFQPAEENFGGAKTLIRAGALEEVSAIFGMHNEPGLPVGEFATRGGAFYANVDRFVLKVTGKGAHAARPHEGKDAILLASQLVTVLQSVASREVNTLDSVVLSVTRIEEAIHGTCCRRASSWRGRCAPTAVKCSSGSRPGSARLPPVSPAPLARRLTSSGTPARRRWSTTPAGPISPARWQPRPGIAPTMPICISVAKILRSIFSIFPGRSSASAAPANMVCTIRHLIRMNG